MRWHNEEHRHSGIRYVTSQQRHSRQDKAVLSARHNLYLKAKQRHPARWSGNTCNWSAIGAVIFNPERNSVVQLAANDHQTQHDAA
jgi:putative transposase